jgi:hypothetical protein
MTSEYREQWPLMLSKLYRIIGVQLYRNGDTYLTVNNQRKTYHLDFRYELNQWYKIKITYSRGKAIVSFNDKIVFKEKLELNTDYPKKAYVLTSCNFSNGICFLGNVRDIKVLTNLKS